MKSKKLMEMFCDKEHKYRKEYHRPFLYEDKVYATDGVSMIFCDASYVKDIESLQFECSINPNKAIPKDKKVSKTFNISDVQGMIDVQSELVDDWDWKYADCEHCCGIGQIKCDICGGEGEVRCGCCEFTNDCKLCVGEGEVECQICEAAGERGEKIYNGKKRIHEDTVIEIMGKKIAYYLFERVLLVCRELDLKDFTVNSYDYKGGMYFKAGYFGIILMPTILKEYKPIQVSCVE